MTVRLLALAAVLSVGHAQSLSEGWQKRLELRLFEFMSCKEPIDDLSPCNRFIGKALAEVYGVRDFEDPAKNGQYLSANAIDTLLATSKLWVFLGYADDQQALNEATQSANIKRAVVAVRPGESHGHIALILPGPQTLSGSWKLMVPNSASFFLGKPLQSYVGDKLSKAFASPAGIKLFGRVY